MAEPNAPPEVEPVAIVSLAGRFPGAESVADFWANIQAGIESISRFHGPDLLPAGHDPAHVLDPRFVGAEGILADPARFDAAFFGYSPHEAGVMDPQHRACLEVAWEAFDAVGYDPARLDVPTGVFLSTGLSAYLVRNLLGGGPAQRRARQRQDGMYLLMHNDKDFAATTVSYRLGLTGPSYAVGSACSSSLVAVHLAVRSLLGYECDLALAGGAFVQVPHGQGYVHTDDGIYSGRGRCAPFDADADGTVGGSGVGMVLLKRLSDARRDGDHVHALILGSAVNNDGATKVGYTAPSAAGQTEVVVEAQAVAGVPADSIGYLEAHGTGTRLGDPIEVAALTEAFRAGTERRQFCALGSVKGNVGHLDAAAGVTGLIKAALVVRDGVVPASPNFHRPNPEIDFATSPFTVPTRTRPWGGAPGPRRAGVSSFGIGGTNAHAVLEEPPPPPPRSRTLRGEQALLLSANSPDILADTARRLAALLRARSEPDLADVAATLAARRGLPYRFAAVGRDPAELARRLDEVSGAERAVSGRPVVFAFPGQGGSPVGTAASLGAAEPEFRRHLDECARLLAGHGYDLAAALRRPPAGERPWPTSVAQPALYAVQYSLARTLLGWGIEPAAMVGHSAGEYAAATLAGVMSLSDALALVVVRARLCEALRPGRMVAVSLAATELVPLLPDGAETAAVNAPDRCVVAGPEAAVRTLTARLDELAVPWRPLAVDRAFHTAAVDPAIEPFRDALSGVRLRPPNRRYVSSLTGDWVVADQVCRPEYWLAQLRRPVRFADALGRCLELGPVAVVETGPPIGLAGLARRHPRFGPDHRVVRAMPTAPTDGEAASGDRATEPGGEAASGDRATEPVPVAGPDLVSLASPVAELWAAGCPVDWAEFHAPQTPRRVPLPGGRLDRRRHWVEPPAEPVPFPSLPELAAGTRAELATAEPPAAIDDHPGLRAGLDRFCAELTLWYLAAGGVDTRPGQRHTVAGIRRRLGVLPQFRRLVDHLLGLLARQGVLARNGPEVTFRPPPELGAVDRSTVDASAARLAAEHPGFAGLVELLRHCVTGYPRGLTEPGEALRLLYPDGRADLLRTALTERTVEHRAIGGLVATAGTLLDRLADRLDRPIRVLEVGAGEGALTRAMATRLGPDRLVYHASDISRSFTDGLAAEARRRGLAGFRARLFDIDRDPAEQGLAGHRYDLVCGLDVVHATPDVRRSLSHLRSLLAPGGILALIETTAADPWLPLIWGLAADWWTYTDDRRDGPLLDADRWRDLLAGEGFQATEVVVPERGPRDAALLLGQQAGRATDGPATDPAPVPGPGGWPAKRADLATWCYQPGWRQVPPVRPQPPAERGGCLLLSDGPLGTEVARLLTRRGVPVLRAVRAAPGPPGARVLDPGAEQRYHDLVRELAEAGSPVRLVVHLWALEESTARGAAAGSATIGEAEAYGLHCLLRLARALGGQQDHRPVRMVAVTTGTQDVLGDDCVHPEHATVASAVKVIPREYPWIACTALDLPSAVPSSDVLAAEDPTRDDPSEAAGRIVDELLGARESTVVAYRGRRRFAPDYQPYPLDVPPAGPALAPRPDGTYLVCGGLGGIGSALADWLGRSGGSVVLTARRPVPPESEWESYRSAAADPTGRLVRRLLALRAGGAEVLVCQADLTDPARMRDVVARAEQRFGPLTGVVHAAGVPDTAGMIQRRSTADTDAATAAKTRGALVLDEVLGDRPLDFFVLCSSIGSVLHKLKFGEVGYVAGNDFLNAFAEYRSARRPGRTVAIAWSDWLDEGMWAEAQRRLGQRYAAGSPDPAAGFGPADDLLGGITRSEGTEVFARILAHGPVPRAVVSTQDLAELLVRHEAFSTADHLAAVNRLRVSPGAARDGGNGDGGTGGSGKGRPGPATPVQRTLAGFWSTLLGVAHVAPTDDFFELGGDSLLALRLLSMLRAEYGVELSVARVFDNPTLAGLAELLERSRPPLATGREEVVL
ncbi:SDR family NAD(P)-dependent oxidoreductase [Plantactinospora sp. CA-294935]|uniref:type I polyketide synthase n=1 Tax=Plantactinospora sp. CA-294935 TaxID=3240012 RepID=UPI003D89B228